MDLALQRKKEEGTKRCWGEERGWFHTKEGKRRKRWQLSKRNYLAVEVYLNWKPVKNPTRGVQLKKRGEGYGGNRIQIQM